MQVISIQEAAEMIKDNDVIGSAVQGHDGLAGRDRLGH